VGELVVVEAVGEVGEVEAGDVEEGEGVVSTLGIFSPDLWAENSDQVEGEADRETSTSSESRDDMRRW
jgi:hypothetical protein